MTDKKAGVPDALKLAGEALIDQSENRRDRLSKAADKLRKEMERQSLTIRDLILAQPPVQLLGYLWTQFHMGVLTDVHEKEEKYRPDKKLVETFQFALEYLHAIWSCHKDLVDQRTSLDEAKATALLQVLDELKSTTMLYCITSSAANLAEKGGRLSPNAEASAKSSWMLIRGHRYQVLEEEFFRFVLEPHADALRAVYGMEFDVIAAEIQAITNSIRTGFSDAVQKIGERLDQTHAVIKGPDGDLETAIGILLTRASYK